MTFGIKKPNILRETAGIAGYFLILFIFLYFIITALFPKYAIRIFRFQLFLVAPASLSMTPLINPHDVIIIKRIDPKNIGDGDIISFYVDVNNDGIIDIVTHHFYKRVLDGDGNEYFLTKSHLTDMPDAWKVRTEDIIGKYIMKIPKAGKLVLFFRSPYGIATIILGITTIYGAVYLLKKKTND